MSVSLSLSFLLVVFLSLPIEDGGVGADDDVFELVETISRLLQEKEDNRFYIHCYGGVGRYGNTAIEEEGRGI